jgi:exonuclease III
MEQRIFRAMVWNCHGAASSKSAFWKYFLDQDVDIALLQEVHSIPDEVLSSYDARSETAVTKSGRPQRFRTCVLSKTPLGEAPPLTSDKEWVNYELEHFGGNLVSGSIDVSPWTINTISVYNPAWPIDAARISAHDTNGVRLTQQKSDVWLCDILWSALCSRKHSEELWVVGGDFNLSETFDSWAGGPHGNKEYLDRMSGLGLVECLRKHQGKLTPTFKSASNGKILHQMDHVWVSPTLATCLVECRTAPPEEIFDAGQSDHLPIITDFDISKLQDRMYE